MHSLIKKFLNIIYPRCCPVCHQILRNQKHLICPECAGNLKPYSGPRCMKCGKPVEEEREYCSECTGRERAFTKGRGIYLYDDRMRASLVKYKYYGRREYGDFYAAAICTYARTEIERWKPDLLIPVPLHPSKKRVRGFNQAEYLAERIGAYYGIPVSSRILVKTRKTKSQKKLDARERRRNLQGAFTVKERVDGLHILIIDDVYTTGSTMDAAAFCLRMAGAASVCFLTVCTGQN